MNFLVSLTLIIGEYEKSSKMLVIDAPDRIGAGKFALTLECHGNAYFDEECPDSRVWDCGGEMAYKVSSIEPVTDDDLLVLKRFMNWHEFYDPEEALRDLD